MSFRIIQIAILTTAMLVPLGGKSLYGQYQGSTGNETVAGGIAGAIIGGIVGKQNDETPEGIAIGAALGALAGNAVGSSRQEMYSQQQAYRQAAYQQQLAQQQVQQQAYQRAASVQDVITMTQNGIGSSVIVNHLRSVGVRQEVGVTEIITLHRSGVDEQVISLMQQMSTGQQARVAVVSQPVRQAYVQPVYHSSPTIVVQHYRPAPPTHLHRHHNSHGREAQRRYEAQRAHRNHLEFHHRF